MNKSEGQLSLQNSLNGLPQWVSERILQQINQLSQESWRYMPNAARTAADRMLA